MTTPPLPLPAEHIPPGVAEWNTSDAQRWLDAVPARWAHPLWALLALGASQVWDVVAGPVAPCTSADPCGTDWTGLAAAVVLVLTLYWVWRQPRLALAGLAVSLVAFAVEGGFTTVLVEPSAVGFLVAAGFTAVGLMHRLAVAGRQRALALEAAGPVTRPLPAAAQTFQRGRLSFVLAALTLAVAAFGCWQAQQVVNAYEERAAAATQLSGQVTALEQDDEADVLVVEADGRTHRLETAIPKDFPVDSRVDLVVDGDWAALVAEPYDVSGWELLTLVGAVPGLAFLTNGLDGRARSKRLRRGRLPVLHVLVREGHEDGRTWVFAADDPQGLRPILHFHSLYAFEDDDEDEGRDNGDDDDSDDGSAPEVDLGKLREIFKGEDAPPPLREAVLYGAPYTGAEVAFVARDGVDDDEVSVECSVTAVKPAVPGLPGRSVKPADRGSAGRRGPRGREQENFGRPVDEVIADMTPTTAPRVWASRGFSRAVGLFLLLVQGGGIWAIVGDGLSWSWLLLPAGLPWMVTAVATALTWRITADRDGLWVTGAWRVRQIPWNVIVSVLHVDDGIHLSREQASTVELSPTGWPWLERRLGREPHAVRAAEELQALLLHPDLRPLEEAPPGQQGMPIGPPLVAVSLLWGTAVLLLL